MAHLSPSVGIDAPGGARIHLCRVAAWQVTRTVWQVTSRICVMGVLLKAVCL